MSNSAIAVAVCRMRWRVRQRCETFGKPWRIPGRAAMKDVTLRRPVCSAAACRHLAVCVIQQAVRDLSGAAASQADQESARTFLSGSPMLYRWCEVANLNAARTVAHATKLLASSGQLAARTRIQGDASPMHARIRDF